MLYFNTNVGATLMCAVVRGFSKPQTRSEKGFNRIQLRFKLGS